MTELYCIKQLYQQLLYLRKGVRFIMLTGPISIYIEKLNINDEIFQYVGSIIYGNRITAYNSYTVIIRTYKDLLSVKKDLGKTEYIIPKNQLNKTVFTYWETLGKKHF